MVAVSEFSVFASSTPKCSRALERAIIESFLWQNEAK